MRSSKLVALALSMSLSAPLAAYAAGEARAPVTMNPAGIAARVTGRDGKIRPGRLMMTTGNIVGGHPELQLTTTGGVIQGKLAGMRAGAQRFFHPIMNKTHDPEREVVVARGSLGRGLGGYVAFLAAGDPLHPMSQARLASAQARGGDGIDDDTATEMMNDHGFEGSTVPWGQRAHILVVPTSIKEHVTKRLGAPFRADDLKLTLALHEVGAKLGSDLKLGGADVWQNDSYGASVGQEHVHVTGRRPGASTPDIEPPRGGRPGGYLTMDRGRVVPMGANGLPAGSR